jgi:hypothetical protein
VSNLLPIHLEKFALAAPPARHSFLPDHHVVEKVVTSHEQVDWYVVLCHHICSKLGLMALDD